MVDMTRHIAAKSDQLNADDLIGAPRTVTITRVQELGADDQPIAIYFDGDGGKPYKPCKGMRRALVFAWGPDGDEYVGRSMTLYNDPSVTWGGEKVGGIRISHMSHIPEAQTFALSTSRTKRSPYTIEPLVMPKRRKSPEELVEGYERAVASIETLEALSDLTAGEGAQKLRAMLERVGDPHSADLLERMTSAGSVRFAQLSKAAEDEVEEAAEELDPDRMREDRDERRDLEAEDETLDDLTFADQDEGLG